MGGWSTRVVVGKMHLRPLTTTAVIPPQVAPEAISSMSLRNISWRAFGSHFKDHRAPVRAVPLVFREAAETGAFFSSLCRTSNGTQLNGIDSCGGKVWMLRCAVLRSKDVSGVKYSCHQKNREKCTLENFKFFFNPSAQN